MTESRGFDVDAVATLRAHAWRQVDAAVIITDADGRIVDWNEGATRLFGWDAAEAIGASWADLAGPVAADPDPRRGEVQENLGRGSGYTGELTAGTKDGRRIPIIVSGRPVRDAAGRIIGSIGIAIDDSRRSHAEERFEVAFQASPVASVMTSGPRQLILDVNPAFEALSGLSRHEAIGRTTNELGLWEDPAVSRAVLELTERHEAISDQAMRFRSRGGSTILARVSGRPITLSDGPAYLWMAVDETDRVVAEEAQRTTAARLAAVVEASPVSITLIDADGLVQLWNPAAERLLGWTSAEVLGQPNPVHAIGSDEVADVARTVLRTGEPTTLTVTVRDKMGHEVRAETALAPVRDATGRIIGLLVMAADIAERERLQDQLRHAQRMESVGQLAGGIAHDFNNLMTAIGGNASLAARQLGDDHPVAEDLAQIIRSTERAVALTRQLLAFSRRQVLRPETLDLGAAVDDLAPMLRRLLGPTIEVLVEQPSGPAWVSADPGQIQQVLLNLAVNARDAMVAGGRLRLTVDRAGDAVRLVVADNGTGMEEAVQTRIFDPFFTTKPAGQGTGLGLAVVHGIVEQSGGRIVVDSAPGRGSTFTVTLPAVSPVAATTSPEAPAPLGQDRRAVILVVEDEPSIRVLARRVLEGRGHEVVEAADGEAGLAAVTELPRVDLVLTDLTMPRMGGEEMARRITAVRPDIPIVFMTGYGESRLAPDGVLDPSIRLLAKPFAIDDLAAIVHQALDETA